MRFQPLWMLSGLYSVATKRASNGRLFAVFSAHGFGFHYDFGAHRVGDEASVMGIVVQTAMRVVIGSGLPPAHPWS